MSVAAARFLAAAYDDVEAAYVWYEHQHAGLGAEFVRAVEAAIAAAFAFPDAHPIVHRDARRILVQRFPYCLFYRLDRDGAILIACVVAAGRDFGELLVRGASGAVPPTSGVSAARAAASEPIVHHGRVRWKRW